MDIWIYLVRVGILLSMLILFMFLIYWMFSHLIILFVFVLFVFFFCDYHIKVERKRIYVECVNGTSFVSREE